MLGWMDVVGDEEGLDDDVGLSVGDSDAILVGYKLGNVLGLNEMDGDTEG